MISFIILHSFILIIPNLLHIIIYNQYLINFYKRIFIILFYFLILKYVLKIPIENYLSILLFYFLYHNKFLYYILLYLIIK